MVKFQVVINKRKGDVFRLKSIYKAVEDLVKMEHGKVVTKQFSNSWHTLTYVISAKTCHPDRWNNYGFKIFEMPAKKSKKVEAIVIQPVAKVIELPPEAIAYKYWDKLANSRPEETIVTNGKVKYAKRNWKVTFFKKVRGKLKPFKVFTGKTDDEAVDKAYYNKADLIGVVATQITQPSGLKRELIYI